MQNNLIGKWRSDPKDATTQKLYGNVIMEFKEDGHLLYTIFEPNKEEIILMTYEVVENFLITDQPSFPQKMQTTFCIDSEIKKLELTFDGIITVYLKIN